MIVELGGVHEHADAVELDVGERFSVGREAGGFDAAFGDAGDDSGLFAGGEVDGLDGLALDAGAADEGDLCAVGRPGGPELVGFAAE